MPFPNIFDQDITYQLIERINKLSPTNKPLWGKMAVGQMLAHCCVPYEMVFEDIHPKPKALQKFFIKLFAKNMVIGEKPYRKNAPTAPSFIVRDDKDFEIEKNRLIEYIGRTQKLGADHFEQKESHSFGPLSTSEWNALFYKHLDHHLRQFGV